MLEFVVRKYLSKNTDKGLVVVDPFKLVIENFEEKDKNIDNEEFDIKYKFCLSKNIFVEKEDVR